MTLSSLQAVHRDDLKYLNLDTFNIPVPSFPPQHLSTRSILLTLQDGHAYPCPVGTVTLGWQTQKRCSHPSQPARVQSHSAVVSLADQPVKTPQTVLLNMTHSQQTEMVTDCPRCPVGQKGKSLFCTETLSRYMNNLAQVQASVRRCLNVHWS